MSKIAKIIEALEVASAHLHKGLPEDGKADYALIRDALAMARDMEGQKPVAFVCGADLERMKAGESTPAYSIWGSPWPTPLYAAPIAQQPPAEAVPDAMKIVLSAMRSDPDYAWSWHCNIAMAFIDAGGDPYTANQGAARFMRLLANVAPAHELPAAPVQAVPLLTEDEITAAWDGHVMPMFGKNGINPIVFSRVIEALVRSKQAEAANPEMTSNTVNDACWAFVEAMPHQLPGEIFSDLKPAIHAAICKYLAVTPK